MSKAITVAELFAEDFKPAWLIQDELKTKETQDQFLRFVFLLRYGSVESCFKCGRVKKFSRISKRRAFACHWCGSQIHPLAGTSMHRSDTPVRTWLEAATLLKQPTPAIELKRRFGVTYKTAWRMKNVILDDFKRRGIIYAFIYEDLNVTDELLNHYKFGFVNKRQEVKV